MNIFTKINNKIPAIGTPNGKHFILVDCDQKTIDSFAKVNKLTVGKPGLWVVHTFDSNDTLGVGLLTLPRRLHPLDIDGGICEDNTYMYPHFFKTPKRELVVQGTYVGDTAEVNPFKITSFTADTGLICLKDLKF